MNFTNLHIPKGLCVLLLFYANFCTLFSQLANPSSSFQFSVSCNAPQTITKLGEHHYLIDFGKAYFGTLFFNANTSQNESLIFHVGEKLNEFGHIDRSPGATIRYQRIEIENITAGTEHMVPFSAYKRNSNPPAILLPDSFGVVLPFRYCEVENLHLPISSIHFIQKGIYYRFHDDASYFISSDTTLNQIWDLCKHTIKATSFTGYYIDGDRERIPYEADAYINQLSHYSVDSVYSIARRTNKYFLNHATWPTEWLLHTVMLFYQDYMYTGDISQIEKYYEKLKVKTLLDLAREDGLVTVTSNKLTPELKRKLGYTNSHTEVKDIVDWPPSRGNTGKKWLPEMGERDAYDMVDVNTVVNCFFYHNMMLMFQLASALNKESDALMFKLQAEKVKHAINTKLFNRDKGIYMDGEGSNHASLHANMFPLAFGLVPQEKKQSVVDFIKSRGMACSVYGAQYLLEALFKANEPEYALSLITNTSHDRTWWNMIKNGSTMTWEAWDVKYKPNLDWNHAWGTAPLNVITRHMCGITPLTPGFKNVRIEPQMAGLEYVDAKVPTTRGSIAFSYKRLKNNRAVYQLVLPEKTQGEFIIPANAMLKNTNLEATSSKVYLKEGKNLLKLKLQK